MRSSRSLNGGIGARRVASQALAVVSRIVADNIDVRIMAGNATDPRIGPVEALAVGEPVGLEANSDLAAPMISHHGFPRSMTLPAEIRNFLGRLLAQIGRRGIEITIDGIDQVRGCAGVAMFTSDSGPQGLKRHLSVGDGVGGVAAEADLGFRHADLAANRLLESLRTEVFVSGGEVESGN